MWKDVHGAADGFLSFIHFNARDQRNNIEEGVCFFYTQIKKSYQCKADKCFLVACLLFPYQFVL
jgi:hypothetical protein